MPSFDGDNLIITLDSGVAEVNAETDLYSDWKEWFKTPGNAKYPLAFDTTGGDPTTATGAVSPFFFLRNDNGWRIRPAEEDAEVVIVGNLYPRDVTLPLFVQTTGAFTVLLTIERDASSVVETITSGTSGLTAAESAQLNFIETMLRNRAVINRTLSRMEIYDDSNVLQYTAPIFEDEDGTLTVGPASTRIDRRDRFA